MWLHIALHSYYIYCDLLTCACFIACLLQPCPPGSNCTICEANRERYCNYSCAIDNGGCTDEEQCTEVAVPDCNPGQCCSPVNVNCSGKHFLSYLAKCDCNVYHYNLFYFELNIPMYLKDSPL